MNHFARAQLKSLAALRSHGFPLAPTLAALARLGLLSNGLSAADEQRVKVPCATASIVAMGYEHLEHGVPTKVRVALTREQLQSLLQLAKPWATPVDLSQFQGIPELTLRFDPSDHSVRGIWRQAVVNPQTDRWTVHSAPLSVGGFGPLELLPLGGIALPPGAMLSRDNGGISFPAKTQGVMQAMFLQVAHGVNAKAEAHDQESTAQLNLADINTPHGMSLHVDQPHGWRVAVRAHGVVVPVHNGIAVLAPNTAAWRPVSKRASEQQSVQITSEQSPADVSLTWSRIPAPPAGGKAALTGNLTLAQLPDGSAWRCFGTLSISAPGAGCGRIDLRVPAGMAITAINHPAVTGWEMLPPPAGATEAGTATVRISFTSAIAAADLAFTAIVALDAAGIAPWLPDAARQDLRLAVLPVTGARVTLSGGDRVEPAANEASAIAVRDPRSAAIKLDTAAVAATWNEIMVIQDRQDGWNILWMVDGLPTGEPVSMALPKGWSLMHASPGVNGHADGGIMVPAGQRVWLHVEPSTRLEVDSLISFAPGRSGARRILISPNPARRLHLAASEPGDDATRIRSLFPASEVPIGANDWAVRSDRGLSIIAAANAITTQASSAHFAIVDRDTVKWAAHLEWQPGPAGISSLSVAIPAGTEVRRIVAPAGAAVTRHDERLQIALAAPTTALQTVDIDLEIQLRDGKARLSAPQALDASWTAASVALAEADVGSSLLEPTLAGLEAVDAAHVRLPDGVSADAVQHRLRATRPEWSIGLNRQALARGQLPERDQICNQIDAVTRWLADGQTRTRVRAHILNRSLGALAITLPAGDQLLEARVNDLPMRPRRDNTNAQVLWLPIPRLRVGEAAVRIELDVAGRTQPSERSVLALPTLGDPKTMRVMDVLWRVIGPDGAVLTLDRDDANGFVAIAPAKAEERRAERASADLEVLRLIAAGGDLGFAALARIDRELARLDLELADAQESLLVKGGYVYSRNDGSDVKAVIVANKNNPYNGALCEILDKRSAITAQQVGNRNQIQFRNVQQNSLNLEQSGNYNWNRIGQAAVKNAAPTATTIASEPPNLGDGDRAPGTRNDSAVTLTGVDLLADPQGSDRGLTLHGSGSSMQVVIAVAPPERPLWPWLATAAAAVIVGAAGLLLGLRRRPAARHTALSTASPDRTP